MLFEGRFAEGIRAGVTTLTFRRWKRRQVVGGNRYRTPAGRLEVETVDVVDPTIITDAEARRAGYPDATTLVGDLRGDPSLPVYRVAFHVVDEPDPRAVLAATVVSTPAEAAEVRARLDRLDRASRDGPWTRATLDAVARHPGVRAADLAAGLGRERAPFKLDVRKLKAMGLTESLERGYRLSPRGRSYLDHSVHEGER